MAKTLEEIIEGFSSDFEALKTLKKTLEEAQKAHEDAAEGDPKVKALETVKKAADAFEKSKSLIIQKVREAARLQLFSEEVTQRRRTRKAAHVEAQLNTVQEKIDLLTLEIGSVNTAIEEARKAD